jgi:hypothetical protein
MSSQNYDPWIHAVHVFLNRVVLFLVLSMALGLAWWAGVLHAVLGVAWGDMAHGTWVVVQGPVDPTWRMGLGEAGVIGAVLTAWLFTFLVMRGRLRRGDRHHRGARVVDAGDE